MVTNPKKGRMIGTGFIGHSRFIDRQPACCGSELFSSGGAMNITKAQQRAAQGERIAHMASRGSACSDEIEDIRTAEATCGDVLLDHKHDEIRNRIQRLDRWIMQALTAFEAGFVEVSIPGDMRDDLKDIGELVRDCAEVELDRLAMTDLRRVLRSRKASERELWALHRALTLVEIDGFEDPFLDAPEIESLRQQIRTHDAPIDISMAAAKEIRRVVTQFS
jgi:hypothetical protein